MLFCGDTKEVFGVDALSDFCSVPTTNYAYYLVLKKINSMGYIFHAIDEPFPIDPVASALKVLIK